MTLGFARRFAAALAGVALMATWVSALAATPVAPAPLAAGHDRFIGGAWSAPQADGFSTYWNKVTPENAGKWGVVEAVRDRMDWRALDAAYRVAKDHGLPFQFHVLVWGNQQPEWIEALPPAEQRAEIEEWFAAVAQRYPDLDFVEVVNEPLHDPPDRDDDGGGNYIAALGGAGASGWDWVLEAFRLARRHFPRAQLLINDYSITNQPADARRYHALVELLQRERLVDGIGVQGHAFATTTEAPVAVHRASLDLLAQTGLPIYVTELDVDGVDDGEQLRDMQRIFPMFWEHPAVRGVTFWGFRPGLWRDAQGANLLRADGSERPALQWLRGYLRGEAGVDRCAQPAAVCIDANAGSLPLIAGGRVAAVVVDSGDDAGVARAARDVAVDLSAVAGVDAVFSSATGLHAPVAVIAGTLGRSPRVDRIVREQGIATSGVAGRDEAYLLQVVEHPEPGIGRALLIAGSDRRGTIFGLYELSRRIGVSPWNWWADVPPPRRADLHVAPGRFTDAPAVRWRGIFINDEEPALGGWAKATFGGTNHRFYERVFQLILRHKANMLWPAMWGKAFYDDDPRNGEIAAEMGVIVGSSHHEPMARAHVEWERHGAGAWDYRTNHERLQQFWRDGIARLQGREALVTVGMRGDGDEPMAEGTAIDLLETIVADQRRIVADVTGRPAAETPQVWALYKEVQDYYDAGMAVPDDVTLLFADDNWGNVRRLPAPGADRAGGYGVYYHFDYVGDPRNYKWLNTVQVERTWEQLRLAYAHGVDRLWIANVGDIKPMELPVSFFLDMAWAPAAIGPRELAAYPAAWAGEQFGADHAAVIGDLLTRYTQYNARRKPELRSPDTWSLVDYDEADRVLAQWQALEDEARRIGALLPPAQRDAYYQLVEYPVLASANLDRLYIAVARNRRHAAQGHASANRWADEARRLFARDAELARIYEQDIAGGKWIHMMSQTRIGYTHWQQPEHDVLPALAQVDVGDDGATGAAIADGSAGGDRSGIAPTVPADAPSDRAAAFVESDGVVAIEAEHFARAGAPPGLSWQVIANLGRTLSAVTAWPATGAARPTTDADGAWLEYPLQLAADGDVEVRVVLSPSLDVRGGDGLRYAVSLGDEAPQVVTMRMDPTPGHADYAAWETAVADSVFIGRSRHSGRAGAATLRLWLVDPGTVFQRIEIVRGDAPSGTLGPPESRRADGLPPVLESIGRLTTFDPAFADVVAADARIEKIADGFQWAEGPAWIADGGYLLFTDVPANRLHRWSERDGLSIFLEPSGYAGRDREGLREAGANGLAVEPGGGSVLLADSGNRAVYRLDLATRRKTLLASHYDGHRFNSPNDVARRDDGAIFFTDPPYGLAGMADSPLRELPFSGVYRRDPDGRVHLLDATLAFPNGIALSPDQRTLYVANSDPALPVWIAYTLDARGDVVSRRVFADASDLLGDGVSGLPDGLAVAADGRLFATGPGGVIVFAADGRRLGRIETGGPIANCELADGDRTLYLTSQHLVARIRLLDPAGESAPVR